MTLLVLTLLAALPDAPAEWAPSGPIEPIATVSPTRYETAAEAPPVSPTPSSPVAMPPAATAPAPVAKLAPSPAKPAQRPFDQRLTALELALSTIVVERPTLWRFEPLEAEAAQLLTLAENEADRAAVRAVGERIDSFNRLASRLRQQREAVAGWRAPGVTPQADRPTPSTDRLAPPVRLTKTASTEGRNDAEGVLRPVVSQRPDAPKYAVVDETGKIAALVTPTPETDARLKDLVGQRVGLQGQRGYLTDLKRDHVVAERVTPLDTIRR